MTLTRQLDELKATLTSALTAEQAATAEAAIMEIAARNIAETAVKTGDRAPDFRLPNHDGRIVSLHETLLSGPVVLVFYRGGWCPYCNLTLRAFQQILPEIKQAGGTLIAVAPEKPDNSFNTQQKNHIEFPMLSDEKNEAAKAYRILFEVPDDIVDILRKRGTDLSQINGAGTWALPMPAVYVINTHHLIVAHHIDADHRRRMEPEEILEALTKGAPSPVR